MTEQPRGGEVDAQGPLMLFDGVCNLCNGALQFMLRVEKHGKLQFCTLQSDAAFALLKHLNAPLDLSTVVYVVDGNLYTHSTAISLLLRHHARPSWAFLGVLLAVIPKPLRDFGYRVVASNRYKWFGHKETCLMPTPALKARFIA
jgi:predicted DCC family thiol-disulfide oxidoreductase YuxK